MRRKVPCTIRFVMYRSSWSRGKKKEAEKAEKKYWESSHKAGHRNKARQSDGASADVTFAFTIFFAKPF